MISRTSDPTSYSLPISSVLFQQLVKWNLWEHLSTVFAFFGLFTLLSASKHALHLQAASCCPLRRLPLRGTCVYFYRCKAASPRSVSLSNYAMESYWPRVQITWHIHSLHSPFIQYTAPAGHVKMDCQLWSLNSDRSLN